MLQPSNPTTDITQAVNRCTQTFHRVKAEHPENHEAAGTAFLAELPILTDPVAFQAYFACLGQALTLGVIDLVDLGRYCHLARMAMSAWKLANPAPKKQAPYPPKGNHSEEKDPQFAARQPFGDQKNGLAHPPNGNHFEDRGDRLAAAYLPDIDMQLAMFKSLRRRGFTVPGNNHLLKHPAEALYYVNLELEHLNVRPPAVEIPGPGPSDSPMQQPGRAA